MKKRARILGERQVRRRRKMMRRGMCEMKKRQIEGASRGLVGKFCYPVNGQYCQNTLSLVKFYWSPRIG